MRINACGATHIGNTRNKNEDNIFVEDAFRSDLAKNNYLLKSRSRNNSYLYAVFDGLGGADKGEIASLFAAMKLKQSGLSGTAEDINSFIQSAHEAILDYASSKGPLHMGTTVAALIIDGVRGTVFHVGDSRVYLYRNDSLERLTRDHSVSQSMIDCGFIEESERYTNHHSGELTQCIGMITDDGTKPEPEIKSIGLCSGDVFILCSDGLTAEINDKTICSVISKDIGRGAEYITADLIKHALNHGGKDNISVITVIID